MNQSQCVTFARGALKATPSIHTFDISHYIIRSQCTWPANVKSFNEFNELTGCANAVRVGNYFAWRACVPSCVCLPVHGCKQIAKRRIVAWWRVVCTPILPAQAASISGSGPNQTTPIIIALSCRLRLTMLPTLFVYVFCCAVQAPSNAQNSIIYNISWLIYNLFILPP